MIFLMRSFSGQPLCTTVTIWLEPHPLSETPVTVHNIAKLCVIDGKNREITPKMAFWGVPKMALGVPKSKF